MVFGFEFGEQSTSLFITIRGTVIRRIFWIVLLFLAYVCAVTVVHIHVVKLGVFNNLVGVLGIIISLLLGFRANNSLARYNEGRNAFATMKKTLRDMTQNIWIQVPVYTAQDLVEKKTVVNLLDGFAHALKHYLREEYSYEQPDMPNLTKFLPKFAGRSKTAAQKQLTKIDRHVACEFKPPTNIPQEILYCLSMYSKYTLEKNINMPTSLWGWTFASGINTLESILSQLESLQRTPIPVCYSSHLEHAFWIYLVALPFQLVGVYEWYTLPIVGFGFFFFIGVMSIALELEDPFGYDDNDLPLDDYCYTIRKELAQITGNVSGVNGEPEMWLLSPGNLPLSPYSEISAADWADKSLESAQEILFDIKLKPRPEVNKSRKEWIPNKMQISSGIENPTVQIADENV